MRRCAVGSGLPSACVEEQERTRGVGFDASSQRPFDAPVAGLDRTLCRLGPSCSVVGDTGGGAGRESTRSPALIGCRPGSSGWAGMDKRDATSTRAATRMSPAPFRNAPIHGASRREPTGGLEPPTPSLRVNPSALTRAHASARQPKNPLHAQRNGSAARRRACAPVARVKDPGRTPPPLVTARVKQPMSSAPWPATCASACT